MFHNGLTSLLLRPASLASAILTLAGSTLIVHAGGAVRADSSKADFNREVRPILSENCYKCHGPDDAARKAKLRFDIRAEALKPAKSGAIPIVPNAPEKSAVIERIAAADPDDRMPPASTGKKLLPAQIETLRRWITQGAPYAIHWAYVKPVRPPVPEVKNRKWARNAVDDFILARLERERLKPSAEADRYTLIRRVSLDLTGLPPTIEEADRFAKDRDPRAYEHMVDRILSKPAFGEHWARLWLDLARYADSAGYADDPPRTIWAYRDYVIKSFNENKPFDRFTLEQIAGDLLGETNEDDEVATAFHRNTMTNNEGGTSDEEFRNVAVVDRVNTTMAVWMATSMGCAQCHNHKYDPITQRDYFRFFAFFNNTADADRRDEAPVLELFTPGQRKQRAQWQAEIAEIEHTFKTPTAESLAGQAAWERNLPGESQWKPLAPVPAKKASDENEPQPADHAVRIFPQTNVQTDWVEFPLDVARLTAVRLETLPSYTNIEDAAFSITHVGATLIVPATNRPAARYVRLELPGKDRILSIAEVQVIHGDKNIAKDGVASQSSTAFKGVASRAIDGNTSGDFDAASTTHTESSENPWWELDLKKAQSVDRLTIWNRTDHNLQERMKDLRISLLDAQRNPVWERTVSNAPDPKVMFSLLAPDPIQFAVAFVGASDSNSTPGEVLAEAGQTKKKGWVLNPSASRNDSLTLLSPRALEVPEGSRLQVSVEYSAPRDHCPPARLRISASADEQFTNYANVPSSILQTMTASATDRSDRQRAAVSEYYRANLDPELKAQQARLPELKKQMAALQPNTVPVMRELPAANRRVTHIQFRGNYLALGDEVTMAVPAAFHPLPKNESPNRLSLAHWLLDKENPLTARVLANRLWEQIFGIGIVRTSDDFGSQGDLPTHPELLDWLACQLRDGDETSGTQPWDIKAFLKLLVTSEAYRQTSRVTPELQERDPDNVLLTRGPRFRVPAEVIRDQALPVSGLLSPKMYGPPVRPPRPSQGLNAAFGASLDWQTSEGEDRFRRAVYIEWRRMSPYPSMSSFDAPSREVCALRRPRSNTPLQALVVLNDPVYVEAAQALARRIAALPGSNADKLTYGFRLCVVRPPHQAELRRLLQFYDQARADYTGKPALATQMVQTNATPALKTDSIADLAAWTAVGNVLLNLDETLMKP